MAPVELDIWGSPALVVGDVVRLRKGDGSTAVIERRGFNPGVFRVSPALSGEHWHIEQELERAHGAAL